MLRFVRMALIDADDIAVLELAPVPTLALSGFANTDVGERIERDAGPTDADESVRDLERDRTVEA